MTRISSVTGGFAGYSAMSRSFAAGGGGEYTGSTMVFIQAAAPTGWVQNTSYDDYTLRITSGSAGTGGTANFSSVFTTVTPTGTTAVATLGAATDATTIAAPTLPGHTHTYTSQGGYFTGSSTAPLVNRSPFTQSMTSSGPTSPVTGQSHIHPAGNTITTSFSGSSFNMSVKYIDCILATRT